MQKIKALLIASIVFTGCTTTKEINCCDTEAHQCDELYPYYNCPDPTPVYHYRTYKRTWTNSYTHGYNSYYPNTQTVYYVPATTNDCEDLEPSTIINGPRPSIYHNLPSNSGNNAIETRPNTIHRPPANNASTSRKKRN